MTEHAQTSVIQSGRNTFSYPLSSFPLNSGLKTSEPGSLEGSDWKSNNIGLPVELRMLSFKNHDSTIFLVFTSGHFIVFKTNQNQSCKGAFESRPCRQDCAV